jgi:hypothetical protein
MSKSLYELKYSFEAPDLLKSKQVGKPIFKYFEKGYVVFGEPFQKTSIILEKRYVFPLEYLEKTDKISNLDSGNIVAQTMNRISKEIKDKKENFDGLTDTNSYKSKLDSKSSAFKTGAFVGLAVGLITSLYLKKRYFLYSILGASLGSFLSVKIHEAKQGNNIDVKPTEDAK